MTQRKLSLKTLFPKPESQMDSFKFIGVGAVLFTLGAIFIVSADQFYDPSLEQELTALLGLVCGGFGFLLALWAQLHLLLQRIKNFFRDDTN